MTAPARFTTFVFDIVGTLVDEVGTVTTALVETLSARSVPKEDAARLAGAWLDRFDATTRRIAAGDASWAPDVELRRRTLRELLQEHDIGLPETEVERLAHVPYRLEPFPRAAEQLSALSQRGLVTGLTNASMSQVATLSEHAQLRWHAVLSTALAQTYKPSPDAYRLPIELLHIDPATTLFVAAHPWDLNGAASAGYRTCLIKRPHADEPAPDDRFDLTIGNLDELLDR